MMRKKIVSLCMALALCLGLLPATALAADGDTVYVGGVALTSTDSKTVYATTDKDTGVVTPITSTEGETGDWNIMWDGSTLTLKGAYITGQVNEATNPIAGAAIGVPNQNGDAELTIQLEGSNTVGASTGIHVYSSNGTASLTITGNGSLNASSNSNGGGIWVQSNSGKATLAIENADVTADGGTYGNGVTVQAGSNSSASLSVDRGNLTATGSGSSCLGIYFYSLSSSNINLNVSNNAIVRANGGIASGTSLVEDVSTSGTGIVFDDSQGTVYGSVTLQDDLEIGEGESLTIPEDSSLDMGGHTITVENGGKLDGTPTGNGTVIDKSSSISYLDEKGTEQSCSDYNVVTANDTQWTTGWYVVNSDVTIDQRVDVSGDVKLILTDGHTLTVNGGIHVTGNNCFTVYGQENGTGKLTATATNNAGAGIGGNGKTTTSAQYGENGGTIIIAGGTIKAVGGDNPKDTDSPCGGAGIGNGNGASNGGSVTIYGGEVNATGGVGNAGIGGDGSTIQISGGTVEATSGGAGAAAIGGTNGAAGTITITESNVTANGIDGTGIGSGWEDHGGTITITNSTVTASGGQGAGIGGGGSGFIGSAGGNGGNVTIVNSTVTASSKEGDSIGAGRNGADPGTLTLSPADSKAIAAKAGADEASALALNGSPFTAETAVTDLVRGTKYFHSEPCDIHTVTVNGSYAQTTGAGNYAEGATVAIDAGTRSGYTFDGWTSADGVTFANAGSAQTTFTMPAGDVTVTAGFTRISSGPTTYAITAPDAENGTVRVSPSRASRGTTVTITVTPDEGYELESLTVLDSRDNEISLTDKGDGKYTFTMPAGRVTVEASFAKIAPEPLPFGDVDDGDWFADAVRFVYANGMMNGVSETDFAPHAATSRSMIVTILYRMEGEPVVDYAMDFTDVASDAYYTEAVRWAASKGIVGGYGNGLFGANDDVTREQLAAILYRYAAYQGYDVSQRADLSGFGDAESISGYAQEALSWAHAQGLVLGFEDGSLRPQGTASRAQIAAVLMRFCETVAE